MWAKGIFFFNFDDQFAFCASLLVDPFYVYLKFRKKAKEQKTMRFKSNKLDTMKTGLIEIKTPKVLSSSSCPEVICLFCCSNKKCFTRPR